MSPTNVKVYKGVWAEGNDGKLALKNRQLVTDKEVTFTADNKELYSKIRRCCSIRGLPNWYQVRVPYAPTSGNIRELHKQMQTKHVLMQRITICISNS